MVESYRYVVAGQAKELPTDPQSETYQQRLYEEVIPAEGLGRRVVRNYVIVTKDNVAQRIIRGPFLTSTNADAALQDAEHKIDAYYEFIQELQNQYQLPEYDIIYGISNCLQEVKDANPTTQFPPDVAIEIIEVQQIAA